MKVFAISTTFFPDEYIILENYKNIKCDIDKYIVVDNSEGYEFKCLSVFDDFEIIYNKNNGVSGGLNVGIKRAIELGADYVILFDQDSVSQKGLIGKLLEIPGIQDGKTISAPDILDNKTGESIHKKFFMRGKSIGQKLIEVDRTQTSGLLVPSDIFKAVGCFDERYFLNFVDTEWCLRAVSRGCKVIINTDAGLFHDFGEGEKKILSYVFSYGKPFRDYYTSRDSLYLLCVNKNSVGFRVRLAFFFFAGFFQIFFLDKKKLRLKYFITGIWHFLKGIRGKGI